MSQQQFFNTAIPGTGTVTSFTFIDANGIAGVVTNPTTDVQLTLSTTVSDFNVLYASGGALVGTGVGVAGQVLTSNGPGVAPSFQDNDGGITTINVNQTSDNYNVGLNSVTVGTTSTIYLSNRATGQLSTTDATPTNIITFSLDLTPAAYSIEGIVTALTDTGDAASYDFQAAFKTDGASATEIGTEYPNTFEDSSLASADITISASGNDVIVTVIGVAATNINWDCLLTYRKVV